MPVQMGAYSFVDVNVTISGPGGNVLLSSSGLSEEGITLRQATPKNTRTMGAAGDGMHSMNASTAVDVEVSLLKTGTGNALLNALYRSQSNSSANWGQNTITITNAVTGDSLVLTGVAFGKQTDLGYKVQGGNNVWPFEAIASSQILGDNYQTQSGV